MFRVVPSPIIRSANNCIYSIWYCHAVTAICRYRWRVGTGLSVLWVPYATHSTQNTVWQIPDAVDTVVCTPDDRWWYHPKHVEQFPDIINRVTLHLVGYILEYSYDARTHEHYSRRCYIWHLQNQRVPEYYNFQDIRMLGKMHCNFIVLTV